MHSLLPASWLEVVPGGGGWNKRMMEHSVTERAQISKHERRKKSGRRKGFWSKKESNKNLIKTGDVVLQSSPFAFVILATHR